MEREPHAMDITLQPAEETFYKLMGALNCLYFFNQLTVKKRLLIIKQTTNFPKLLRYRRKGRGKSILVTEGSLLIHAFQFL